MIFGTGKSNLKKKHFQGGLDSLCNFGFKNGGLHPGGDIEWFPGPQNVV